MFSDEHYLEISIRLAADHMAAGHGGPFGALVVHGGEIIGEGWNQVTSASDPTAHAEVVAIRAAAQRLGAFHLAGSVLYASCEPCPMCLAAAYWARVDRIVYAGSRADAAAAGFDDERLYRELALPPGARALPMQQMLRDRAAAVFKAWERMPDKVRY